MKKINKIIVFYCICCLLLTAFFGNATADVEYEGYNFEAYDEVDEDITNKNIDIIYAKVEESGDDLIFTLKVDGSIVGDDFYSMYEFKIADSETNNIFLVFEYNNLSQIRIESQNILKTISYNIAGEEEDTLTLTAPKEYFVHEEYSFLASTPWQVSVDATDYSKELRDTVDLQPIIEDDDDDNDTNDENGATDKDKDSGTPGFELIIFISAVAVMLIVFNRRKNKKIKK